MADPRYGVPPGNMPPGVAPRRSRSGCWIAVVVVLGVFVLCAGTVGFGVWYWFGRDSGGGGEVGRCFPAATDGPLDTSHGTVSCAHPNAIWKVTKVLDGRHEGDVIGTCGTDADALVYRPEEDKSYCLDYIN